MEASHTNILLYTFLLFSLLTLTTQQLISNTISSINPSSSPSSCNGSIGECNEEMETLMESEISRRFLEQRKYISPGALKRDQPVCNGGAGGQPYSRGSGCLPSPSKTYNRGCSKYYRCRDDS